MGMPLSSQRLEIAKHPRPSAASFRGVAATAPATIGAPATSWTHHSGSRAAASRSAARRAKIIKLNVMEEIEAPQKQRAKPRSLTEVQAGKLLASLEGPWMEPAVTLTFATGLRRGEVLGLRWGDVDLDGARLHVRG